MRWIVSVIGVGALLIAACQHSRGRNPSQSIGEEPSSAPTDASRSSAPADDAGNFLFSRWLPGERLAWKWDKQVYLVDPESLEVDSVIVSPDGAGAKCLIAAPDKTRFLLVSLEGQLSLWTWDGALIASSDLSDGVRSNCHSHVIEWSQAGDRILKGASFWSVEGERLVGTQITEAQNPSSGFFRHSPRVWVQDGVSLATKTFDGTALQRFECETCVFSSDESLIARNQFKPKRSTEIEEVETGRSRWRSSEMTAVLWAPSGKWLFVWTKKGPGIANAADGRLLATWDAVGEGCCGQEDESWVGDMLVHAYGDRLTMWTEKQGILVVPRPQSRGEARISVSHCEGHFVTMNMILSRDGKVMGELENPGAPRTWSPTDTYLEGSSHAGPVVWEARTGTVVAIMDGVEGREFRFWSEKGDQLLIPLKDRLVRWRPSDGVTSVQMHLVDGNVKTKVGDE